MRLESIAVRGCESFAENTTVKVLPGITAIIAPGSAVDDVTLNMASALPSCEEPEGGNRAAPIEWE